MSRITYTETVNGETVTFTRANSYDRMLLTEEAERVGKDKLAATLEATNAPLEVRLVQLNAFDHPDENERLTKKADFAKFLSTPRGRHFGFVISLRAAHKERAEEIAQAIDLPDGGEIELMMKIWDLVQVDPAQEQAAPAPGDATDSATADASK
jgi:hypothetical protein